MTKLTERDALAIILEEMKHDFKAFGEGLMNLTRKVDTGFKEVNQRLDRLELDVSVLKSDVSILKSDVSTLKVDMSDVKRTLQINDDQFQDHEVRISNLENT